MSEKFDVIKTVISQYANSPILNALIEDMADYFDGYTLIDDFYNKIWNVDTATGYGLDVWGRIVGVGRSLEIGIGDFFGFNEMGSPAQPWNQAPFYSGPVSTTNFDLADDAYRTLIFAKALANITDCSIPSINNILLTLFPGQPSFVVDNGNMSMTYRFKWNMSEVDQAIVGQSHVLPKPAGVSVNYVLGP